LAKRVESWVVTDEFWQRVEPLIPLRSVADKIYVRKPGAGRPPSQANAYVIFETLNDRGKDLSASDLLKNHLFGRAEDRIEEVQTKWNQMLGILEVHGGDDLVITYIRQLWSATREVAREKELFAKIKEKIVTPQQAVDFASELVGRANHYSAMLNPAHSLWKEHGTEAQAIISSLNLLKA